MQLKTINEMAQVFKVSVRTFRTYINEYNLPFYEMGRQKLFDEREVLQKLKTHGAKMESPDVKPKKKSAITYNKDTQKYRELLGLV
jgi:excisionase family DNA binding protein